MVLQTHFWILWQLQTCTGVCYLMMGLCCYSSHCKQLFWCPADVELLPSSGCASVYSWTWALSEPAPGSSDKLKRMVMVTPTTNLQMMNMALDGSIAMSSQVSSIMLTSFPLRSCWRGPSPCRPTGLMGNLPYLPWNLSNATCSIRTGKEAWKVWKDLYIFLSSLATGITFF